LAELVGSTAIRGLGNALNLIGERSSPPGIELALPGQPIHDLTSYVRYGSSPVFAPLADGWVTMSHDVTHALTTFASQTVADWSAVVTGDVGIGTNRLSRMGLWIYNVTVQVDAALDIADVGSVAVIIPIPTGIDELSSPANQVLFASKTIAAQRTALSGFMANAAPPRLPIFWVAGQPLQISVSNLVAASVIYSLSMLCRLVPLGSMPPGL